jgi:hypothetical protein
MWTWCEKVGHGSRNKVAIEFTYIPYACVLKFLESERGDVQTLVEWNKHKNLPPRQTNVK